MRPFKMEFTKPLIEVNILVHLKPKKNMVLESVDSHLCAADTYVGKVRIAPYFLQLSWRIVGPKKTTGSSAYTPEAPASAESAYLARGWAICPIGSTPPTGEVGLLKEAIALSGISTPILFGD